MKLKYYDIHDSDGQFDLPLQHFGKPSAAVVVCSPAVSGRGQFQNPKEPAPFSTRSKTENDNTAIEVTQTVQLEWTDDLTRL